MNRFDLICLALTALSWTVLYLVLRGRSITISFSSPGKGTASPTRSRRQRATSEPSPIVRKVDPLVQDVQSALIGLGCKDKKKAAAAAARACYEHRQFEPAFRAALAAVTEAA